jgi:hypothetical protein
MTDRPRMPGRPLSGLLERLSDEPRLALLNAVGAGLFNARHAAECATDPGRRHCETDLQLLTYLSTAMRELEAARAIVAAAAEGGEAVG